MMRYAMYALYVCLAYVVYVCTIMYVCMLWCVRMCSMYECMHVMYV